MFLKFRFDGVIKITAAWAKNLRQVVDTMQHKNIKPKCFFRHFTWIRLLTWETGDLHFDVNSCATLIFYFSKKCKTIWCFSKPLLKIKVVWVEGCVIGMASMKEEMNDERKHIRRTHWWELVWKRWTNENWLMNFDFTRLQNSDENICSVPHKTSLVQYI